MASGTIVGTTANQFISSKIEWTATANKSANTSTVTAILYYRRTNSGYTTGGKGGTFSITINGQTTSVTKGLTIGTSWVSAVSAKATVSHKEDGTKTITISAQGSIPDTTLESTTCSDNVDLDPIDRGTSITSVPDAILGNNCSITWTPKSSEYYYKVKFSLKNWNYETEAFRPGVSTAYTYTGYVIPLKVAEQFPIQSSETMTVTLTTILSDAKTAIGSDSRTFKVSLPNITEIRPSVAMATYPMNESLDSKFSSVYIQGRSKLVTTLSGEGKYGSWISEYQYWVEQDGTQVFGSRGTIQTYSQTLFATGKLTIKGYTHDSRGYMSAASTQEIEVSPYRKPRLFPVSTEKSVICGRCLEDGTLDDSGTFLRVRAIRDYSKIVVDETQYNYCLVRYRFKAEGETAFSDWKQLVAKEATEDEIDEIVPNVVSSTALSYVVEIGVIDDIGEYSTLSYDIPTDKITLHLKEGGNGVAMGKYATKEDTFECDYEAEFNKGITLKGNALNNVVIEEGSSGIWTYRKWSNGTYECWGRNRSSVNISTAWNSIYYGEISAIEFPITFTEVPICLVSVWLGGASQPAWMTCAGNTSTTHAPTIWMCRPNTSESASFDANYYVKGKWK